jgi:hypothetical protein
VLRKLHGAPGRRQGHSRKEQVVSPHGIWPAVVILAICVAGFVAVFAVSATYDYLRQREYGDEGTATDGVRWLIRHVPWVVILGVMLTWGGLMFAAGFLLCHFAASPLFQP